MSSTDIIGTPSRTVDAWSPYEAVADLDRARVALSGRTVWHVNSTATGGGVSELVRTAVEHHSRQGIRARWLVPEATKEFFYITKRIHHRLHGQRGAEGDLGDHERTLYDEVIAAQAGAALAHLRPGDLVVLHDPQTLGLGARLIKSGMHVVWRCHVGTTRRTSEVEDAWSFLRPYLAAPSRCVFSHEAYIPPRFDRSRATVILPSIDPRSPKNRQMSDEAVHRVLQGIGLERGRDRPPEGRNAEIPPLIDRARVVQDGTLPAAAPVILQISRWDVLKDMTGVLRAFAEHVAPRAPSHLVLAGPDPRDIPDDPEGFEVMDAVLAQRVQLAPEARWRVHLVMMSLRDLDANALIVNALQRRASVVTQKSLQEGFGLTVTEAMWKGLPVVATASGGICQQIVRGEHGLLIDDPTDLSAFGTAVIALLTDRDLARQLGRAARRRCAENFMVDREMGELARLYADVVAGA